jgi:prepilin-type N-terminal cleavage/methylation domain-containing protein
MKQKDNNRAGFTLIEIIAVLFVVAIGLTGVLALIQQNVRVQGLNEERIISNQLAQEGIELARRIRDENWINSRAWDDGLAAGTYIIDYDDSALSSVASMSNARLQVKDDGDFLNFYLHDPLEPDSLFSRLITISDVASSSLRLQSTVEWQGGGSNVYTHTAEAILYDWR